MKRVLVAGGWFRVAPPPLLAPITHQLNTIYTVIFNQTFYNGQL